MESQDIESVALADVRTLAITQAQAQNLAHWGRLVERAEEAAAHARECYLASASAVVAGHVDGQWQIISVELGGDPRLVVSPLL